MLETGSDVIAEEEVAMEKCCAVQGCVHAATVLRYYTHQVDDDQWIRVIGVELGVFINIDINKMSNLINYHQHNNITISTKN